MGRAGRVSRWDQPRRAQQGRLRLLPHAETPCAVLESVEVEIARQGKGRVELHYFVLGDIAAVEWPDATVPGRGDRLWERSCFEFFVKPLDRPTYFEFNFSPSTQWASYRFSDYRTGMQIASRLQPAEIKLRTAPRAQTLSVVLDLGDVPGLRIDQDWSVAVSAVVEEKSGTKSYWALKHPVGKPDFHHADCFALHLLAPVGA